MNRLPKIFLSWLVVLTVMVCGALIFAGCDDDKNGPIIHYKVYRLNQDGSSTLWTLPIKPELANGFACWPKDNGKKLCISGTITIEEYEAAKVLKKE